MGLFTKIFGGSKTKNSSESQNQSVSSSTSYNKAYDGLNTSFSPLYGESQGGANSYNKLLYGDPTEFNAYKNATGFDAMAQAGTNAITGNAAYKNVLRSGALGKSLTKFGVGLQDQYAQSFLDRLLGRVGIGMQAGNLVSGAGGMSQSNSQSSGTSSSVGTGSSTPGIAGLIGSILGAVAKGAGGG